MARLKRVSGPTKVWTRPKRDGSRQPRWRLSYYDNDGERRRLFFDSRSAADSAKTEIETRLRAGTYVADSKSLTVKEAGERWADELERRKEHPLERSTIRGYRQHVNLHIGDPEFGVGGVLLSRLTAPQIDQFKAGLLAHRSDAMTAKALKTLRTLLDWCQARGYIATNPAKAIRHRRSARHDEERDEDIAIPSPAEAKRMLQMVDRRAGGGVTWERAFVYSKALTGLRASEMRGLRWRWLGLEGPQGRLRVRERADFANVVGPVKSAAARRTIILPRELTAMLKLWRLVCPKGAGGQLDLVFPRANGSVEDYSNIYRRMWIPLMNALGWIEIPQTHAEAEAELLKPLYGMHTLRHLGVWLRIQEGWQPKRIQKFVGHANLATTMDTYGGWWPDDQQDEAAADAIERKLLA
jgi:integrase